MTFQCFGPNAILLEFAAKAGDAALQKCRAIITELDKHPPNGLLEFTPGHTNLLLEFDQEASRNLEKIGNELTARFKGISGRRLSFASVKKIKVKYDGPDLERVARLNKISIKQVIKYHTSPTYKVYLLGFSPGFPYLGELHARIRTPRLPSPRPKVEAGSVGIGGGQTGVYTVASPGGWNIIGHTTQVFFEPKKASAGEEQAAFYLKQGDRVRFVAI